MFYSLMWDRDGKAPADWASHVPVQWADIEGAKGQYGFDRVETWLSAAERPCFLSFQFCLAQWKSGITDITPQFHRRSLYVRSTGSGIIATVPDYGDAGWRAALYAAVYALAERYRDDPRVVGFWWGPGVDDEVNAIVNWPGDDFYPSLREQLTVDEYLSFIRESTQTVASAWVPTRTWLAAASAPATPWGQKRRDVIRDVLSETGVGYRMNGLLEDRDNAVGLGLYDGLMVYDMRLNATGGFAVEEGVVPTNQPSMRLYWMILQALHWRAEVCNLDDGWLPAYELIKPILPFAERWIVFRDREYPAQMWGQYGQSGVPGHLGSGITSAAQATGFDAQNWGVGRWYAEGPLTLRLPGLADGDYAAIGIRADGTADELTLLVRGETAGVPAGRWHRIDVHERVVQPPTQDARLAAIEDRLVALEARWERMIQALTR